MGVNHCTRALGAECMTGRVLLYLTLSRCPYCRAFAPTWHRARQVLEHFDVRTRHYVCDLSESGEAQAQMHGVHFFPALVLLGAQDSPRIFKGVREAATLVAWARS